MKEFHVYRSPTSGFHRAIKHGFSWPAFFFTIFWAALKRTPISLSIRGAKTAFSGVIVLLTLKVINLYFESPVLDVIQIVLTFSVCIYFGINGNGWRRRSLDITGWSYVATVRSTNSYDAIQEAKKSDT